MHPLTLLEIRFARGEIDIPSRTKLPCRLEDVRLLPVEELYLLHVIQGEAPQVHLSVLGVAELHPVVIDRRVLRAHRAYVDGLDAPHSSIVLELHAGEIAQGIRHRECVKALQFSPFERLRNDDILVKRTRRHLHLLYLEAVIQGIRLCIAEGEYRGRAERNKQYEKNMFCHC